MERFRVSHFMTQNKFISRLLCILVFFLIYCYSKIFSEYYPENNDENSLTFQADIKSPIQPRTRVLVMPLHDKIFSLGVSAIMLFKLWGINIPIEIPFCGSEDLSKHNQEILSLIYLDIHVYDVCLKAWEHGWKQGDRKERIFCSTPQNCYSIYRSWFIKPLSLLLSEYDEILLIDADVLLLRNPLELFHHSEYRKTGTLFFHDRTFDKHYYLDSNRSQETNGLQQFLMDFNVTSFQDYPTRKRAHSTVFDNRKSLLSFSPSEFLLQSHSWNRRSGHQQDSSLVLWNKKMLPRATEILASFLDTDGSGIPPSYGDKEMFFIACELAETEYFFSPFGVGSFSPTPERLPMPFSLCGQAVHYFPSKDRSSELLYINGNEWINWSINQTFTYTKPVEASAYFESIGLPANCLVGRTLKIAQPEHITSLKQRQDFYSRVTQARNIVSA